MLLQSGRFTFASHERGRGHVNVAAERLPNGGCRAPFPNALNLLVSTSEAVWWVRL